MNKKYIILNFLHGNGPYLRTTEMAVAVNDILEKKGLPRLGIIVPWVYKLRQHDLVWQNFAAVIRRDPNEILLDENLGGLLEPLFYNENRYEDSLRKLLAGAGSIEEGIEQYLAGGLRVKNLLGQEERVRAADIVMEINRCPLVSFKIKLSYYTGFGYMSEILERAAAAPEIATPEGLLRKGSTYYRRLEQGQSLHFIAEPATFTYLGERPAVYPDEILTPPNSHQSAVPTFWQRLSVRPGIYATITGVYSRMHLLRDVYKMGLKVYTHKPSLIPGSRRSSPSILGHPKLLLHFARIGWGSAWLSFFTGTPLVTPPYDSKDDPEVYFNNICVEQLGLGRVYRGEPVKTLLDWKEKYVENVRRVGQQLSEKYGTMRGVPYTAQKIVDHFLNS